MRVKELEAELQDKEQVRRASQWSVCRAAMESLFYKLVLVPFYFPEEVIRPQ